MARGLNKVLLIGNLGADPEIKYSQSGTPFANFRLATSESRKNTEGEWENKTEWHKVVMIGRQAEVCKDYLHKGSKVFIEGRLQTRSWDDQNGQKHYITEIIGFNMVMLDPKGADISMNAPDLPESSMPDSDIAPDTSENSSREEDDLPF
jgi:single-strand DNA-binding protein